MAHDVNIGDIWQWVGQDYRKGQKEYWLITDCVSGCWTGLCLMGEDAGRTDEITVGDEGYNSTLWSKVA